MRNSLLAFTLAVAAVPFTFAAQANPPATPTANPPAKTAGSVTAGKSAAGSKSTKHSKTTKTTKTSKTPAKKAPVHTASAGTPGAVKPK